MVGVRVKVGVRVGTMVAVGRGVLVRVGVRVMVGVRVGVMVGEAVGVKVGVALGRTVGAFPVTVNRPEIFQNVPLKIWTSYSPDSHAEGSGAQSVYPYPPVPPFHGYDS